MNFHDRMSELARTFDTSPGRALELAVSLEHALTREADVDPRQVGWARDYRVRCLYRLGRHAEGVMALVAPPRWPIAATPGNAAWLYGLGAEMALLVGSPRLVLVLLGRALELRLAAGDALHVRALVEAGDDLLRRAGDGAALGAWRRALEARAAAASPAVAAALTAGLAAAPRDERRAAA